MKHSTNIDKKRTQLKDEIQKMDDVLKAVSSELGSLPEDMVDRLMQRISEWSATIMATVIKVSKP